MDREDAVGVQSVAQSASVEFVEVALVTSRIIPDRSYQSDPVSLQKKTFCT